MKNFKDFEEDIYKCSRCGLCQYVCPVYKATLNECAVSKGKFNILNGILKGDLSFNKNVKKYLDLCTSCNACKDFCPSSIDAKKIFIAAKSEYHNTNNANFYEKAFNSYKFFKIMLYGTGLISKFYRFLEIKRIVRPLKEVLVKTALGKRLLLLDYVLDRTKIQKAKKQNKCDKTALYFEGCFNKYITPETKNAVKKLFEKQNIKLVKRNTDCCGVSFLNDGNITEFKKIIKKNLKKLSSNYDYIITDCASCNETLKSYKEYYQNSYTKEINAKTKSILEFIQENKYKAKRNFKIAIHKPCHEEFDLKNFVQNNINNIEYIETENYDSCCGLSGTFALKNINISKEISKQKAIKYINKNVEIILTTCPACQIGLEQGLLETNSINKPVVMNLFVFLAKYC